ncbi:MAG: ERF family protein [Desulfobacteraceae bacterium]|nr:ERF family protein [Desulfobacteraceae bacterium]
MANAAAEQQQPAAEKKGNGKAPAQDKDFVRPKTLAGKLAGIIGEVGWVQKRGRNEHFKYDYVTEADLADTIRPLMAKYGVGVAFSVLDATELPNSITQVKIQYVLMDADSGEREETTCFGRGQDKADKGVYKAITGATKYWLYKTFLVSTGDDPELETEFDRQQPAAGSNGQQTKPAQQRQQQNGNGQQLSEDDRLRVDYGAYERDLPTIRALTTPAAVDKWMADNKAAVDANRYAQYYYALAAEVKKELTRS